MTNANRIAKGMYWDRAWTLTRGCTPVTSGCANCWSAAQSHIRSKQAKPPQCYVGVTDESGCWNGVVEPLPENLDKPLRVRKPTTWAVWNDLFHEAVPEAFIRMALQQMRQCRHHIFLVLTKRHGRMREIVTRFWATCCRGADTGERIPQQPAGNIWLGASASTQADLDRVVPDLLSTPAAVRWLSLEPLLGAIDVMLRDDQALDDLSTDRYGDDNTQCEQCGGDGFVEYNDCPECWGEDSPAEENHLVTCPGCAGHGVSQWWRRQVRDHSIQWVVVGSEAGRNRRECKREWVDSIVEQCREAGVPCFVKQVHDDGKVVHCPAGYPQEMPRLSG